MPFFIRQPPSVGLDVGSAFVRAVALCHRRGDWSVLAAGQATAAPSDADPRPVIAQLLDRLGLRRAVVTVAVPAQAAVVRRFRLPREDRPELTRRIALETEEHLAFGGDPVALSYQVLEPPASGEVVRDAGDLDVLWAAVRRADVSARAGLIGGRGRRAGIADVDGLALANVYVLNHPTPDSTVLLLHVGARSTVVALLDRGVVVTTRGLDIGVASRPTAEQLAESIRDGVAMPADRHPASFDRVVLSGGGAHLDGLTTHVAAVFGRSVEILDPVRRILRSAGGADDPIGPEYALAVGLALRRRGDR